MSSNLKLKIFSKDFIKKMKRQGIDWKKIFAVRISDIGLVSEYTKNFYKPRILKVQFLKSGPKLEKTIQKRR